MNNLKQNKNVIFKNKFEIIIKVIIGIKYLPNTDIWSNACMIFEMLTGDFLFEPRKGADFSKNEDHLA